MKQLATEIDFAGSYFVSCKQMEIKEETELFLRLSKYSILTVFLCSWEKKTIELTFSTTHHFSFRVGGYIRGLFQVVENTDEYFEFLKSRNEVVTESSPYKEYVVMDTDDRMILHIIAEQATAKLK